MLIYIDSQVVLNRVSQSEVGAPVGASGGMQQPRNFSRDPSVIVDKEGNVTLVSKYPELDLNPYGKKNFYHEPESPSRAFFLEKMGIFYLLKLCYSIMLTTYLDVPAFLFPAWLSRWVVLQPLAKATKGTVDGVCLALHHGWAINLLGGFTHCTTTYGDMFNIYPDITLAVHYAKKWHGVHCKRILIINTSVVQANGVARELPNDGTVYLCDIYDASVPPKDQAARYLINQSATVSEADNDESYLSKINHRVNVSMTSFNPDFVIYIAGYDCLTGDKKGKMNISESVTILRDELVFRMVKETTDIPILMVVGGCYQNRQESTIARSIRNLVLKFNLSNKPIEGAASTNVRLINKLATKGRIRTNMGEQDTLRRDTLGRNSFGRDTMGNFSRYDTGFSNANGRTTMGNRQGFGAAPPGALQAVSRGTTKMFDNDPLVNRLTQGLIYKKDIETKDEFSYR